MIEAYKVKMSKLPANTKRNIKTGLDVAILLIITFSVITAYTSGKLAGKVEFCQDQDMILIQQAGQYHCEFEKDYIERKQSIAIGLITDKNLEDKLGENDLQLIINE